MTNYEALKNKITDKNALVGFLVKFRDEFSKYASIPCSTVMQHECWQFSSCKDCIKSWLSKEYKF